MYVIILLGFYVLLLPRLIITCCGVHQRICFVVLKTACYDLTYYLRYNWSLHFSK